ncbi:hypothetical protein AAFF_G00326910 [Aldrovandia affinis]|uniref:Uncharacterized protein n=1 Tax=Aldrovandia affinis TaxID=143900 RepID=A0AAD7T9T1_9TELE|nr:hypothetical protein AAFF_G00326910 [Aldrovandia affinis]
MRGSLVEQSRTSRTVSLARLLFAQLSAEIPNVDPLPGVEWFSGGECRVLSCQELQTGGGQAGKNVFPERIFQPRVSRLTLDNLKDRGKTAPPLSP